ncbi:hypothetical protein HK405_006199 [Cladochytrium tenue]|nr:hypothetical protein HK405_006199 [Cladochytrium tenue]
MAPPSPPSPPSPPQRRTAVDANTASSPSSDSASSGDDADRRLRENRARLDRLRAARSARRAGGADAASGARPPRPSRAGPTEPSYDRGFGGVLEDDDGEVLKNAPGPTPVSASASWLKSPLAGAVPPVDVERPTIPTPHTLQPPTVPNIAPSGDRDPVDRHAKSPSPVDSDVLNNPAGSSNIESFLDSPTSSSPVAAPKRTDSSGGESQGVEDYFQDTFDSIDEGDGPESYNAPSDFGSPPAAASVPRSLDGSDAVDQPIDDTDNLSTPRAGSPLYSAFDNHFDPISEASRSNGADVAPQEASDFRAAEADEDSRQEYEALLEEAGAVVAAADPEQDSVSADFTSLSLEEPKPKSADAKTSDIPFATELKPHQEHPAVIESHRHSPEAGTQADLTKTEFDDGLPEANTDCSVSSQPVVTGESSKQIDGDSESDLEPPSPPAYRTFNDFYQEQIDVNPVTTVEQMPESPVPLSTALAYTLEPAESLHSPAPTSASAAIPTTAAAPPLPPSSAAATISSVAQPTSHIPVSARLATTTPHERRHSRPASLPFILPTTARDPRKEAALKRVNSRRGRPTPLTAAAAADGPPSPHRRRPVPQSAPSPSPTRRPSTSSRPATTPTSRRVPSVSPARRLGQTTPTHSASLASAQIVLQRAPSASPTRRLHPQLVPSTPTRSSLASAPIVMQRVPSASPTRRQLSLPPPTTPTRTAPLASAPILMQRAPSPARRGAPASVTIPTAPPVRSPRRKPLQRRQKKQTSPARRPQTGDDDDEFDGAGFGPVDMAADEAPVDTVLLAEALALRRTAAEQVEECRALRAALVTAEGDRDAMRVRIEEAERMRAALEEEVARGVEELSEARAAVARPQRRLLDGGELASKEEVELARREMDELEVLIKGYQAENEKLVAEVKSLRAQLRETEQRSRIRVESLQRDLAAAKSTSSAATAAAVNLSSSGSTHASASAPGDAARLGARVDELESTLAATARDAAEARAALEGEATKLRAQLADARAAAERAAACDPDEVARAHAAWDAERAEMQRALVDMEARLERAVDVAGWTAASAVAANGAELSRNGPAAAESQGRRDVGRRGATRSSGGPPEKRVRLRAPGDEKTKRGGDGGVVASAPELHRLGRGAGLTALPMEDAEYIRHLKERNRRLEAAAEASEAASEDRLARLHNEFTSMKAQYEKRVAELLARDEQRATAARQQLAAARDSEAASDTRIRELEVEVAQLRDAAAAKPPPPPPPPPGVLGARVAELERVVEAQSRAAAALRDERAAVERDCAARVAERDAALLIPTASSPSPSTPPAPGISTPAAAPMRRISAVVRLSTKRWVRLA